jgi:hypothetical protein
MALNEEQMKTVKVKGKVFYNEAGGLIKVLSKNGRLSFPFQLIETTTPIRKRIRNYMDLLKRIKEIRATKSRKAITKRMVIEERIGMHLRTREE